MLYSMSSRSTNQYRIPLSSSGLLGREVCGRGAANYKIEKNVTKTDGAFSTLFETAKFYISTVY